MAKQTRGKNSSIGNKTGKRSRHRGRETGYQVIDINRFSQRKHIPRIPACHNPLIQARNLAQGHYLAAIKTHQLTFGPGPAGTGKTLCATAMAVEAFERREVARIIFSRPAIEAGEQLGFLPGRLQDKLEPWFGIFRSYPGDMPGRGVVDCTLKNRHIVFEPLAFMRDKAFDDAFVLMDEAQNCTRLQLKMFLTRIGEHSRVVINGDTRQSDLGNGSGLADAARRLAGLNGVYIHEFESAEIVRSGLVRSITTRYETG